MRTERPTAPSLLLLALVFGGGFLGLGCSDPFAEMRDSLSPADLARFERGEQQAAPCWTCHDLAGTATKIGPHLRGLEGRRAGGLENFAYSAAMSRAGLVWDRAMLDAFLAEPQRLVPGNRMVSPGVAGDGARADLVFFLIHATRPLPDRATGPS